MAVLSDLLSAVRRELNDQPTPFVWSEIADGETVVYTLGYKPLDEASLLVTVDDVAVPNNSSGYSVDNLSGSITFVTAPDSGATIKISGSFLRYFTDQDLCAYLSTAITQHTYNKTDSYGSQVTINSIPAVEEYPIVILTTLEALWALSTDSAFDIDITAPDGVHIPRAERFQQLTALIAQRQQQYKDLCAALNIGLWRIEMGTLRRVSRTTNKLVPIYIPQEVDDSRKPERVFMQNDLYGRNAPLNYGQIYDLTLYQGDSFSCDLDFPFDVTGYNFKAQIRTYPNSPSLYATFTVTVVSTSPTTSKIRLSLNKKATDYMPARAFWDLQATTDADPNYEVTYIRGQVFTIQQVTLD